MNTITRIISWIVNSIQNSTVETYIIGAITALVAAVVGAYITYLFEKLRGGHEDDNIFSAFKEELVSNLEMLSANSVELEEELADLSTERLTPMSLLYMPTWDVLKTHVPRKLVGNKEAFRDLALTMNLMLIINEHVRSRENFKINGVSMNGYTNTLAQRDSNILTLNARLLKRILELRDILGMEFEFSSHRSKTLTAANKEFNKNKPKGTMKDSRGRDIMV